MPPKPRFRSHFRVDCTAQDGLTLLHETGAVRLEGPLFRQLAPHLDGRCTLDEIAARLAGDLSPVDVAFGISWLEEHGFVVQSAEEAPPGLEGLVDALGLDPGEACRGLRERSVHLVRVGDVPLEPLERSLRALGVRVTDGDAAGGLRVAVTEDYLHEELGDLQSPWMLVKPVGTLLWVGPLFEPGRRGCWHCLAERLRAWRREGGARSLPAPQPVIDSTLRTGLGLAATEILKWVLQGASPALERTLIILDVKALESARHGFSPVAGCPVCGPAVAETDRLPSAPVLMSRAKVFVPGGGGRAATPAETLQRYGHLISPLCGIVDRVTPSREETHDLLHVYTAAHAEPPGAGWDGPRLVRERRRSAGRGITPEQARAAALCEALERYSGFVQGTESRREASFRELGDAAIPPNSCLLISERQYAEREAWNRLDLPYDRIPEPLDEEQSIDWTAAWSLTGNGCKWLPATYCFYDHVPRPGHRFCRADSNGCAAGSCLEEAVLQGFFEIVERDAVAIWWYNRLRRPAVRLDSFHQPYFTALRDWLARLGREVWVLDVTTDLGIPAFVALSREVPRRPGDYILGAGAHLDPEVALARALTEVNQFLPGFLAGRPRRILSEEPGEAALYLEPDPAQPSRGAEDFPLLSRPDLREEIELCLERARSRGLEVLMIDQTREDVGLPVVRVVVPGMRLFRARFAPGRLYDVPVALGWLPAPLGEAELNPVHILI